MKRVGNIYQSIICIENLQKADEIAQKGKANQYGVKVHNSKKEENILKLHQMLNNKTYQTSTYDIFKVYEPKEREVYRLPYFPDRITHHAIMNILEPIFVSTFTKDTYSCIKGRGIHKCSFELRKALKDSEYQYCLKMDIKKFYPNIDHDVLKSLLRRKLKDKDLLWLLDEIIDSADGVPIRKGIKKNFARKLKKKPSIETVASYLGWANHCNSRNLIKKLLTHEQFFQLQNKAKLNQFRRRQNQNQ